MGVQAWPSRVLGRRGTIGKHSHFWIRAYKGITLTGDPFWTKIEETFSDPHFGKGRVLINAQMGCPLKATTCAR